MNEKGQLVQLMLMIKALKKAHESVLRDMASRFNLSGAQLDLLWIVYHRSGATTTEIAEIGLLHISTVMHLLTTLEKNDLTKRIKSDRDKRTWHAHITEKGKKIIEELIESYDPKKNIILKATSSTSEKTEIELNEFVHFGLTLAKEIQGEEFYKWINQNVKQVSEYD